MIMQTAGLTAEYGAVRALDRVDFTLEEGTVHGVIGSNGAGKSTFIDLLSGRKRPTRGEIRYQGQDVTRRSVVWRRRHGVARSFQRTSVFPSLTVGAQMEIAARRVGERDLSALLDALDLEGCVDVLCRTLSYGEQRRVDIGLAMVGSPQVLLLDEPAAGLTQVESLELARHVRSVAKARNAAVVFVEHDVEAVFQCSDEVTVLDLGTTLAHGSVDEVRTNPAVVEAYLGRSA